MLDVMKLFIRNNIWWVSHGSGKNRIRQSTGKADRTEAEAVAKEICAPAMLRREADVVEVAGSIAAGKRQQAKAIESSMIPLAECFERFPFQTNDGHAPAPGTISTDRQVWRKLVRFCAERGVTMAGDVTEEIASEYIKSLSKGFVIPAFDDCKKRFDMMGVTPNPFVKRPRKKASDTVHHEPLSEAEIDMVVKYLESPGYHTRCHDASEFALYFRFLLYTGLRMGDAATMKVSQCDFERKVLKRMMDKTDKEVEFPMHKVLFEILPREGEYIFPHISQVYLHKYNQVSERFYHLFKRLGLWRGNGVICTHSMRATFATICCEAGVPMAVIQSWLGHSSQTVTRIYAHFYDMQKKRAAIEKFPEF